MHELERVSERAHVFPLGDRVKRWEVDFIAGRREVLEQGRYCGLHVKQAVNWVPTQHLL
jgi:hypothetical protein